MRKTRVAAAFAGLAFATPVLPQTAASQTCSAAPHMVFFGPASDKLTPQAAAILSRVAMEAQACGAARVLISAHTDRKGSKAANLRLSRRVAASVRLYLTAMGVPDGAMTTEALGETRPLIETRDGVGEPRNRRAEITLDPGSGW